ncbi:MAG TPA: hypothetical protein VGN11_02080, partial [Candidatus Baltobacteraceae bacterium]|nr:hypothetical protein [Candidatus Baltobacteraceae bacterium]
ALRLHAKATERELPIGVVNSIWDAIDVPAQPSFLERARSWMRPAISLPLAAAAALVLYFGVVAHQTPAQVAIDAGYYLDDHAALTSTVPFGEGNAVPVQLENDQSTNGAQTVAVQTVLTMANVSR